MLQTLRQSAADIGRLLLPLLLLSWLTVFCGDCFALAEVAEMASHATSTGHSDAGHDCCDEPAVACLGAECEHGVDGACAPGTKPEVDLGSLLGSALPGKGPPLGLSPRAAAMVGPIPISAPSGYHQPPLYLRNCTFLI